MAGLSIVGGAAARLRRVSRAVAAGAPGRVRPAALPGLVVERWRRSLQTRVAATTFAVSGVVVLVLGVLLLNVITAGLLDAKRRTAVAELSQGLTVADGNLAAAGAGASDDVRRELNAIVIELAGQGTAGLFYVVVLPSSGGPFASGNVDLASIPADLKSLVAQGYTADAYAPIRPDDGTTPKGLIVGAPISGPTGSAGAVGLYYLFPLGDEERTVALVRRTVLLTGLVLVVLVVAIAMLVTRQVVRPVRMAAQTAGRLAAGRLQERMAVRGRDELAMLASAFNDMADSLQRQIGKLEEMSRLQRRFTSDVSHELRTPLTTVRMAADVLHASRDAFRPEVSRSAELLQAELDRFESLLADLLEISRYDAHVAVLDAEPIDLRSLVRGVVSATEAIAIQQRSPVLVDLPAEPVVAEVDARRVARILRNLIVNAVEHGGGHPVEVRLVGDELAVAVTVRDYGVGLRPGEAALVFDRFWRADLSRDRRTGGTGLGLSISLEDARLHGGWLHAWGRPGSGAQFRLTLPVHAGGMVVASPLPMEPPDAGRPARGRAAAGTPGPPLGGLGVQPAQQLPVVVLPADRSAVVTAAPLPADRPAAVDVTRPQ